MISLNEDMLKLVRHGREVEETELVDLRKLIESCWHNIETEGTELNLDGNKGVRANRFQLRHLLENLLGNAADHGGPDVTGSIGILPD
jgi:signal transduction histidine kinase